MSENKTKNVNGKNVENDVDLEKNFKPSYPCGGSPVRKDGSCKKKETCANGDKCSAVSTDAAKKPGKLEVGPDAPVTDEVADSKKSAKRTAKVKPRSDENVGESAANAASEQAKPAEAAKPKEPKTPKVTALPIKTQINQYGFLALGKPDIRAIGLTAFEPPTGAEGKIKAQKLAANQNVEIIAVDLEKKTFTVAIV